MGNKETIDLITFSNMIYGIPIPVETAPISIIDVKFNGPATIVFWSDNTKTVVKCSDNDNFDPEKGLAMAICKKLLSNNKGSYYEIFKKWCP